METSDSVSDFATADRVIVLVDLAGYSKAFQAHGDLAMAAFTQQYYDACVRALTGHGGMVVKFIGDACLATFAPDAAAAAVQAVAELQAAVAALAARAGVPVGLGANLHKAAVVEGEFGTGAHRRPDIIGRGVNQTFLLGGGAGVRLSEPVYRALPSAARGPWRKHKPPAVYHLERGDGILAGAGKDAATNAARW